MLSDPDHGIEAPCISIRLRGHVKEFSPAPYKNGAERLAASELEAHYPHVFLRRFGAERPYDVFGIHRRIRA